MMRPAVKLAPLLAAVPLLLAVAACGDDDGDDASADTSASPAPSEVEITHYSGTDTVPVDPDTVVVMDTGVLLTLDALGIEVDAFGSLGVPAPEEYADVLEDPDHAPVGTAFEPDYEAINALEPDLIIVATRSSATYPEMSRIAPTVDLTLAEDVDYLTAFRQRHEAIGQIFGIEDEVEAQLSELEAEAERVAAMTADAGDALIVLTSGAEISAYGPGSRFGVVHDVLGYAAADESLERDATHGDVISFEFIHDAAPDVLFVVDRGAAVGEEGQRAEQVLDNDLVRQTPAWQNDRVAYVDGFSWYMASDSIPALRTIIAEVEASVR